MVQKRREAIRGGSWRREGDPELLRSEQRCSVLKLGFFGQLWSFFGSGELVALWFSLSGGLGLSRSGEEGGVVRSGWCGLCGELEILDVSGKVGFIGVRGGKGVCWALGGELRIGWRRWLCGECRGEV